MGRAKPAGCETRGEKEYKGSMRNVGERRPREKLEKGRVKDEIHERIGQDGDETRKNVEKTGDKRKTVPVPL